MITLMIDADDTLWKNNIFFEKARIEFIDIIRTYKDIPESQIRDCKRKYEKMISSKEGYGSKVFVKVLCKVVEVIIPEAVDHHPKIFDMVRDIGNRIFNHPIEFFDGVPKHLELLSKKYQLILVTKGNVEEQNGKIKRSGIQKYFSKIEILHEKNEDAYQKIVDKYNLNKKLTWMIGNSPKSDINPPKNIGLNTVLIPYHMTWELEKEEITKSNKETVVLDKFTEIAHYIESVI